MPRHTFSIETTSLSMLTHLKGYSAFLLSIIAEMLRENPEAWMAIRFEFLPFGDEKGQRREIRVRAKGMNKSTNEPVGIGHPTTVYFDQVKRESMWDTIGYIAATLQAAFALDPRYQDLHFTTGFSDKPGSESWVDRESYRRSLNEERQMFFSINLKYTPDRSPEDNTYNDLYTWD